MINSDSTDMFDIEKGNSNDEPEKIIEEHEKHSIENNPSEGYSNVLF